jgi:predicted lipoprotein with Yx(FWY)xxD motif
MTLAVLRGAAVIGAILCVTAAAHAQEVLTADNGMTLYTFDKDKNGVPTCYDACADNWPHYLASEGDDMGEGWTTVKRKDGTMQWAYDGKPVYFFKGDTTEEDANGDGLNGVWHVILQD